MDRIKSGSQRTEELNERLAYRNVPDGQLQPQFDCRPQSTKYAKMPIVDRRERHNVPLQVFPAFNVASTFNPGNAQAPWSGFATNINQESVLRNQFYALQNGANQACYVPSKNSQLYNAHVPAPTAHIQPFPSLFERTAFEPFNPCPSDLGVTFFENCTRQQVKELA
jgi:hypothetical protein